MTIPNTNNNHQQMTSPSTPLYPDLINDEPEYSVHCPPTATAVFNTSFRHDQDQDPNTNNSNNKLVISIPPSNVLLDEPYASSSSSSSNNSHQYYQPYSTTMTMTTTTSPPAYQNNYQSYPATHYQSATPTAATATAVTPQHQQLGRAYRYINGRPVKPKNAHLPDAVLIFKEKRKGRTIAASVTGGAIGLIALGPFGAVIGATAAYATAKTVGKQRERKLIHKCMTQTQQPQYGEATTTTAVATPVVFTSAMPMERPRVFTSSVPMERHRVFTSSVPIERAEAA